MAGCLYSVKQESSKARKVGHAMSDEMIPDDAEPHPDTGILRQIDLFFGRRHRFHYLWVGFAAGLVVVWLAQSQLVEPRNMAAYQREFDRLGVKIERLEQDIDVCDSGKRELLDSIDQINSYGIHMGRFEVGSRNVSMVGGTVRAELRDGYLDVDVDSTGRFSYSNSRWSHQTKTLPIGEGVVNPIFHGSLRLNLICSEVTDTSVTINVYERK